MTEHDAVTDAERMIQRFVDQDLSGDERVQLLLRLGRDKALRERVIDLERLVLGASRLPRPLVPDGFVANVMERISPEPSAWRRTIAALWVPRSLQWNLAGAMACVVLLVAGAIMTRALSTSPGSTSTPTVAAAPDPATSVLVRLVVLLPEARMVEVAGDFNGWDPRRTPLEQSSTGAWTVTLPLEPGRYEYMFVVDGQQWIADPFAVERSDDGFGSQNAVLDVRPSIGASL